MANTLKEDRWHGCGETLGSLLLRQLSLLLRDMVAWTRVKMEGGDELRMQVLEIELTELVGNLGSSCRHGAC